MNKLILNLDIYSLKNIENTCQVYADYASIKIIHMGSRIELEFDRCKYDSKLTMREFENYLINVENAKNVIE